jgi:uncharacterized protein
MSDPAALLLSVRGESRQMVAPDYAAVAVTIASSRGSKLEAVQATSAGLDSLTADLAARGGVALDTDTGRHALTWSAQSVTTYVERFHDKTTGRSEPTGLVNAAVAVTITVRAFELLDALGTVLAVHELVSVHEVTWHVDWDNPAWRRVRAAAIQSAIGKGRDYASALGVSLRAVEHIADAGLLGGENAQFRFTGAARAARAAPGAADSDTPSLDPVPQELAAIIEARFTADGVSLTAN